MTDQKPTTHEACACDATRAELEALRDTVACLLQHVDALEAQKLKLIGEAMKAMEAVALAAQLTDAVSRIKIEEVNSKASSTRYGYYASLS